MQKTPDIILKYFPKLDRRQVVQFNHLEDLYRDWNSRINLISRQDIGNLLERHVLYSLAIAKVITFKPGTKILDAGTGGGFPGIPLAIMFQDSHFHLVDSTAKKLTAVRAISEELSLQNVSTEHARLEEHQGKYDFVVSRAVTTLPVFYKLVYHLVSDDNRHAFPNGVLYLKGGDVEQELDRINDTAKIYNISDFFSEEYFTTKKIIHIWK